MKFATNKIMLSERITQKSYTNLPTEKPISLIEFTEMKENRGNINPLYINCYEKTYIAIPTTQRKINKIDLRMNDDDCHSF